jgi:hypothetical protein
MLVILQFVKLVIKNIYFIKVFVIRVAQSHHSIQMRLMIVKTVTHHVVNAQVPQLIVYNVHPHARHVISRRNYVSLVQMIFYCSKTLVLISVPQVPSQVMASVKPVKQIAQCVHRVTPQFVSNVIKVSMSTKTTVLRNVQKVSPLISRTN